MLDTRFIPGELSWPLTSNLTTDDPNRVSVPASSTNIDFSAISSPGQLPPGSTFARASGATRYNHRGYLEEVASNVMRPHYNWDLLYNEVSNPWGDGSPPTGWLSSNVAGVTISFLASGVREGIPFNRWRVSGNSIGGGFPNLRTMMIGDTLAKLGDSVAAQYHFEIVRVGGTNTADITGTNLTIAGYTLANTQAEVASVIPPNGANQTFAHGPMRITRTFNNAATQCAILRATIVNSIGWVHDWDFEIGFPILNRGLTYLADSVPFSTLVARKNNVPQYGLLGHLMEDTVTNQATNPRGEYTVAPTFPTVNLPSTWSGLPTGVPVKEVTGFATINGVPCILVRFSGVPTTTGPQVISVGSTGLTQPIGTIVSNAVFISLAAGTFTNVSGITLRNAAEGGGLVFTPTSKLKRMTNVRTLTATAAETQLRWNYLNTTTAVEFTLAIGCPSMEYSPFVSSLVLPPPGTLAASTRAADLPILPGSLVDHAVSTIAMRFAAATNGGTGNYAATKFALSTNVGSISDRMIFFYRNTTGARKGMQIVSGGAPQAELVQASALSEVMNTGCMAWDATGALMAWDGGAVTVDNTVVPPALPSTGIILGGRNSAGADRSNDILRFVKIWSGVKLSPAQVMQESLRTESTNPSRANLDLDFSKVGVVADLPSGSTFTRSSGATRINHRGYLEELASNTMRPSYDPALIYNEIANPWGDGAAAGVLPTGWSVSNVGGLTWTVLGLATSPEGLPMVRIRMSGTRINASYPSGLFIPSGANSRFPVVPGDQMAFQMGLLLESRTGASLGPQGIRAAYDEYDAASTLGYVARSPGLVDTTPLGVTQWFRFPIRTIPATGVASANMGWQFSLSGSINGDTWDVVFGIVYPSMNRGGAYLPDSVPLATLAARKNNVPQYGLLGLRLEEAATNTVTNPRCEGATPGSPGTWPTGWVGGGGSTSIIGTGTEEGIPYIDFRVQSAGALSAIAVVYINNTSNPVTPGLPYTQSQFCRLVAGSLAGVTIQNSQLHIISGGTNDGLFNETIVPTTAPLHQQRTSQTRIPGPTITGAQGRIRISSTGACDFTLRLGGPQFEQQAFATSLSLPAVGTPAASTRARDYLVLPPAVMPNFVMNSMAMRYSHARAGSPNGPVASSYALQFGVSFTERASFYTAITPANTMRAVISGAGGTVMDVSDTVPAVDAVQRTACMAWGEGSGHAAFNGGPVTTDLTVPSPNPVSPLYHLNSSSGAFGGTNINLRFLRIWNGVKLNALQVQQESNRTT